MRIHLLGLLLFICIVGIVSAENTYAPVEQPTVVPYGTVNIHVLCMHNLFSKTILVTRNDTANGSISIMLKPDGKITTELVAGDYQAVLVDGNSGHSETRNFHIENGYTSDIWFIGHAVSIEGGIVPKPTETPTIEPTSIPTTEPTEVITTEPTIAPTETITEIPTEPTISPTPDITEIPTEVPTEIVTTIPTTVPTETITTIPTTEDCHHETVCNPGYWEFEKILVKNDCCYSRDPRDCNHWIIIPRWHPKECHRVWVCGEPNV